MTLAELVKQMIDAYKAGDWLTALSVALRLAQLMIQLRETMYAPKGLVVPPRAQTRNLSHGRLIEKIEAVKIPHDFPVEGMHATDAENPWIAVLMPLVMEMVRRLLERWNR